MDQRLKRLPGMRRPGFDPWVGKIPWRRKWQPTPVLLPGESHGRRSLVGYSPWGCKESDTTERLHSLTHSLIELLTICNFMDSIQEVMNWVIALRIQGPNNSTAKSVMRGSVKGRSHKGQLQILLELPQELASFSLLFMICSLSCWAMSLTISIRLHKSSILYSRRGRVLSFQLSVGLALSYSVKPPQPGSLVGPVKKSTAIILIRDRGQG